MLVGLFSFMNITAAVYLGIGMAELILHHNPAFLVLGIVPTVCLIAMVGDINSTKPDRERRPWLYHKH